MTNLTEFLRKYRAYSSTEEKAKLARMFMLADLHPLSVIWQVGSYLSWTTFLRSERLAPPAYLASFEEAMKLYSRATVERIGADAAVALARIEPHLRDATLKRINSYIKVHGMRPHFRMVYTFVRGLRATVVVRQKGKTMHAMRH